jgi:hypothetical protein
MANDHPGHGSGCGYGRRLVEKALVRVRDMVLGTYTLEEEMARHFCRWVPDLKMILSVLQRHDPEGRATRLSLHRRGCSVPAVPTPGTGRPSSR